MLHVIRAEIHNIIMNEDDFEVRQPILARYQQILEAMVEEDHECVEVYSLLAMLASEQRLPNERSLHYLMECYRKKGLQFSKEEYAIWATNMAYFSLEEGELKSVQSAANLLRKVARQDVLFPQTFYAYGRVLYELEDYKEASRQFHKCFILTKDKKYRYNEAICLIMSGEEEKAISLLKEIQVYPFECELDAKVSCILGKLLALNGRISEARSLARELSSKSFLEFSVDEMELADFMYLLEEYDQARLLYEKCNHYLINEEWISRYFYTLKELGLQSVAIKKMRAIQMGIRNSLLDVKHNNSLFDEITERDEYIEIENLRLKKITEGFQDVFERGKKPKLILHYDIQYFCFYIGCPRHC